MTVAEDPRFGSLISEHRHTYTYPVLVGLVAACLFIGGVFVAVYAQPVAGSIVALASVAIAVPYIYVQSRHRLYVYENGLRLAKGGTVQPLLWRDIAKVNVSYSYHAHPDTIIDIDFRQGVGPRLVLRMNWTRRKELARHLWPLLASEPEGAKITTAGA